MLSSLAGGTLKTSEMMLQCMNEFKAEYIT
jgi:hypothetical protein